MEGDGPARRCSVCATDVHDLDALGPEAAALLLAGPPGCIRSLGHRTWSRPTPARRTLLRTLALAGLLAATSCATGPRTVQVSISAAPALPEEPNADDARGFLLASGWTATEIRVEALAQHNRATRSDYEPPVPGTSDAELAHLLGLIAAQLIENSEVIVIDDTLLETGHFIGRRGR